MRAVIVTFASLIFFLLILMATNNITAWLSSKSGINDDYLFFGGIVFSFVVTFLCIRFIILRRRNEKS